MLHAGDRMADRGADHDRQPVEHTAGDQQGNNANPEAERLHGVKLVPTGAQIISRAIADALDHGVHAVVECGQTLGIGHGVSGGQVLGLPFELAKQCGQGGIFGLDIVKRRLVAHVEPDGPCVRDRNAQIGQVAARIGDEIIGRQRQHTVSVAQEGGHVLLQRVGRDIGDRDLPGLCYGARDRSPDQAVDHHIEQHGANRRESEQGQARAQGHTLQIHRGHQGSPMPETGGRAGGFSGMSRTRTAKPPTSRPSGHPGPSNEPPPSTNRVNGKLDRACPQDHILCELIAASA